jgi:hypothetical protein
LPAWTGLACTRLEPIRSKVETVVNDGQVDFLSFAILVLLRKNVRDKFVCAMLFAGYLINKVNQ